MKLQSTYRSNYVIVANNEYIKYVKSLIYSISQTNREYKIFLYLINPDKPTVKNLRKKFKDYNTTIEIIKKKLDKEKNKSKIVIYSEEGAYSANIRGKILKELIETKELDNLTYIDADSLIYKPFEFICPIEADIAFYKREIDTCSSGLISFNITDENKKNIIRMLDFFQQKIDEYGITTWFSDQTALKDVYHEFIISGVLKFYQLPTAYFDWKCFKDSIIWMGKGKKKDNVMYIKLQKEFEGLF